MLTHIASVYGGTRSIILDKMSGKSYVIWAVNDKAVILGSIIPLLMRFPPLTTRVTLQLSFMLRALAGMTIADSFATRACLYDSRQSLCPLMDLQCLPAYFSSWLSGAIEAEG